MRTKTFSSSNTQLSAMIAHEAGRKRDPLTEQFSQPCHYAEQPGSVAGRKFRGPDGKKETAR